MKYEKTVQARFLERPNRFVAVTEFEGKRETVHVKNTGRCRELLLPGADIILEKAENPARKTRYDLISVMKKGLGWVNIDSQAPNRLVREWLETRPAPFEKITRIRPEYAFGQSRIDFYLTCGERRILMEVKGCTLETDGVGYFPDAPTLRGTKHLRELADAVKEGYECCIVFVIAMPGVRRVLPNEKTDPEFSRAFRQAVAAGVHPLYLPCDVRPDEIRIIG